MEISRKKEETLGRGQPIPEDIVRSFCKRGRLQTSASFFDSFSSSTSEISFSGDSDLDSTPTIDLLKAAKRSLFSFVTLDFLVGNMDDLQKK